MSGDRDTAHSTARSLLRVLKLVSTTWNLLPAPLGSYTARVLDRSALPLHQLVLGNLLLCPCSLFRHDEPRRVPPPLRVLNWRTPRARRFRSIPDGKWLGRSRQFCEGLLRAQFSLLSGKVRVTGSVSVVASAENLAGEAYGEAH